MHTIRFTRHAVTGETRATCTCGSSICGDRDTVTLWANYHAEHNGDQTPSPGIVPFKSGLADRDY